MKRKCDHCRGRGGYHPSGRKVITGLWVSCIHCLGKGTLFAGGRKPRPKKPKD